MRRKSYVLIGIVLIGIVLIATLLLTSWRDEENKKTSIFDNDDIFWMVYIQDLSMGSLNSDGIEYAAMQENGIDYVNYWGQAGKIIQKCYYYHYIDTDETILASAKEIMECIMGTFERNGFFPRPEYKASNLETGWVSSMDAPVIMLASQMLWEITGETKYQEYIADLKSYILEKTSKGGFNYIFEDSSIWPLEYAWNESDESNNMYVLNGSLVGYLSVKAVNQVLNNKELDEYCEKVEKCYERRLKDFLYKNGTWSYYMLNERTVIPIHYAIFELKLFRAANYLEGFDFFEEQMIYREDMLRSVLKTEFYEEESGKISYCMLRAASPNYYQIDTYGTELEIYNEKGELIVTDRNLLTGSMEKEEFCKGQFISGEISVSDVSYYKVYSIVGNQRYFLFEDSINVLTEREEIQKLDYQEMKAMYDAEIVGANNLIKLDKENHEKVEGDIIFELSNVHEATEYTYLLEIENLSVETITLGLKLYDESGYGVTRYYTPLVAEKNLVAFDVRGFVDGDKLKNIKSIWLRLYNNGIEETEPLQLRINGCYTVSNNKAFYDYVTESEYKINPQ